MDIQYKSNTFLQDQKLRLLNPELKRNEEHNIKYELIEDIKTTNNLGDVTVYLPNFMELLWNWMAVRVQERRWMSCIKASMRPWRAILK